MLQIKVKTIVSIGLTVGIFFLASFLTFRTTAVKAEQEKKPPGFPSDAPAVAQPVAKPKGDQEKLQGTWTCVSAVSNGKPWPQESASGFVRKLIIKGETVHWLYGPCLVEDGVLKLDPGANPKSLDISFMGLKNLSWKGIYRFDDDRLTICMRNFYLPKLDNRPKNFSGEKDSGSTLIVLKMEAKEDKDKQDEQKTARQRSNGNLLKLARAMHEYYDNHNHLPPPALSHKGKPLLSWRVAILPELGFNDLYQQFKLDEPWDNPANKVLLRKMPKVYAPVAGKTKVPHSTYYQVFVGPGAGFEEDKELTFKDFTDGTSQTLLIVEAFDPVPWTKPSDLPFDADNPLPEVGGVPEDGLFSFAMADSSVQVVPRNPEKAFISTLRTLITRNSEVKDIPGLSK